MQKIVSPELSDLEADIRRRAEELSAARKSVQQLEGELKKLIDTYQAKRQQVQRDLWKAEGKDWCSKCGELYPCEKTQLVYKVFLGGDSRGGPNKFIVSCCEKCADKTIKSRDNIQVSGMAICGGQIYCLARRTGDGKGFESLELGKYWEPIRKIEEVCIQIESDKIPEALLTLGNPILSDASISEITIGEKKILN